MKIHYTIAMHLSAISMLDKRSATLSLNIKVRPQNEWNSATDVTPRALSNGLGFVTPKMNLAA